MQVISVKNRIEWNRIVKSFQKWDIYFLCEYAESLKKHGDGEPYLFYFSIGEKKMCFVAMLSDIAETTWGEKCLEKNSYYDLQTPYGYGGTLQDGIWTREDQRLAYKELEEFCIKNNIVSYFIRFSPWLNNQSDFIYKCNIRKEKQTIYIDTSDPEIIFKNMDSKNRNMIRKAQKSGVRIFWDEGNHLESFFNIYVSTMDNNKASEYFYFTREYFQYLKDNFKDNIVFFYSVYKDKIIGSSIFMYNDTYMHYHLSGTYAEYRNFAPTNLLLYEASLWANKKGIKCLHLGGGIADNDSLFGFKKQFNKKGYLDFYIGRMIFSSKKYNELLEIRSKYEESFNIHNNFFIQYRR